MRHVSKAVGHRALCAERHQLWGAAWRGSVRIRDGNQADQAVQAVHDQFTQFINQKEVPSGMSSNEFFLWSKMALQPPGMSFCCFVCGGGLGWPRVQVDARLAQQLRRRRYPGTFISGLGDEWLWSGGWIHEGWVNKWNCHQFINGSNHHF